MRSVCEKLTVWAQAKGHYDDNDNDNNLAFIRRCFFRSTGLTAHEIFSVVLNRGNTERFRIVQLDPEGGEFTSVGEIHYLWEPSVVVCANFIFCLGDFNCSGLVHQFDLVTRTAWTPTQLVEPVHWPASAASGHEVIVSGGWNKIWQTVATCSIYAPATNRWTSLWQLRHARHAHRMCWLPNGRVFAIGRWCDGKVLSSTEMLERAWIPAPREEASEEWTNVAPMKTGRYDFGCCVAESRIVVAGGKTVGDKPSSSVEYFSPPTPTNIGQWTLLTNLASAVGCCFLVPSAAGLLLIDQDSAMQLGRRKAQVASSSEWTWEPHPRRTSFSRCWGLVSLPLTAGATQR